METVEILESSLVVPSEDTPKERQWLSNLDIMMFPTLYTSMIYLYKSNGDPEFFSVTNIKTALAKALVIFYPLAGRLTADKNGRLEIDCNGEGAMFVVARSNCTFDELKNYQPTAENRKLFVPVVNSETPPLLLLQITFLKSRDVVIGVAFNHCIIDGHSDFHFLQTLTNIAKGNPSVVPPPCFDRTLLRARSPPFFCPVHHPEHLRVQYLKRIEHTSVHPPYISAILKLSRDQIEYLKSRPHGGISSGTISTFHAVSAHLWKCLCLARGLSHDRESYLFFPVQVRSRISPPLPKYYFGNAITCGSVSAKVSEVMKFIPERIQEAIGRIDDAYVRGTIDHLELVDKEVMKRFEMTEYHLAVTSWLGMPCYDADFGYGNPVFMTRAESSAWGVAVLTNNPGKDQGISVLIGLEVEAMEQFKNIFYELN